MALLVGTSGWFYEDWKGTVYPQGLAAGERLPWLAARLPTVEVNVTFYRTPSPKVVEGWIRKVEDVPAFEFSLKAPKDLTQNALAKGTVEDARRLASEWREQVVRPIHEAGRLGALLLQLSPGVLHNARTLERLAAALDALREYPSAVEFRNKTWLEGEGQARLRDDALELLEERDACLVAIDGPGWPSALFGGEASHAYVRFHGRNADVWHKHRAVEKNPEDPRMNRYDFLYDEKALRPWADHLARLGKERRSRVYFNNHPGGQAYADAALFEDMLTARGAPLVLPASAEHGRK